ncbi:hypothetical protein OKA05_25975 [Luteolibacter arcticus]|uniref:HEAT repeat domain-containing protein n=1 Tax=Luteolibacter arcticus TaxID=1581411 RepID=A0ABT3GRA6_9BACT|nr:hypothetical protein [Luteolibacter arcticus]MCW1926034.1 hypothetical protein [Luteolibacter arcticus]
MEISARELLLDLIFRQEGRRIIPDSLSADEEAVDWLFHLLHADEFPSGDVIEFLRRHRPEDPRFVRWKNRAFRPGLGEDGMLSEDAYKFIEKHEPDHPWLDPFMAQAAYGFRDLTSGIYLGKDFASHLRGRFESPVDDTDLAGQAKAADSSTLAAWIADSSLHVGKQFIAAKELCDRGEFDFLFDRKSRIYLTREIKDEALDRNTPAVLSAARRSLVEGANPLASEILLTCCTDPAEFVDLVDRSVALNRPDAAIVLTKLEEFGAAIPPATASRLLLSIAESNPYHRNKVVPVLLAQAGDDPDVIARIKSWACDGSEGFEMARILSHFLDANREQAWVRETALAFRKQHDGDAYLSDVIARIGDEECIRAILDAFDSSLSSEASSATNAAGHRLHQDPRVRDRLLEKARAGDGRALQWIARRYPEDPEALEILREATRTPGHWDVIRVMCLQGVLRSHVRERFLKSLGDPSASYPGDCEAILAVRSEREAIAREIGPRWELLGIHLGERSNTFPMWFPYESFTVQIMEGIRSGELLKYPRELILQLAGSVDVSEALRDGIRAAADKFDLDPALLLLGMIYGDRPETVSFFKEFTETESAMVSYGAETAFAEVLRLGKRGDDDFSWAVDTLRNSSGRKSGGIACYGPKILVHFFGSGERVVQALQEFAMSPSHPLLATASTRILMDAFPNKVPGSLRAEVEAMPVEGRRSHVSSLRQNAARWIPELVHFTLHDPDASIRKEAMSGLAKNYHMPGTWRDPGFAFACLQHSELAGMAATLLAKWSPEDEAVAQDLVEAARRFPKEDIPLQITAFFGNTASARALILEQVRESQKVAAALVDIPRCTCRGCLGFDAKQYAAMMLRLHHPPFDQDPEAKELIRDILNDRWVESSNSWEFIKAVTVGLDDAATLVRYEEIIRSAALVKYREWACSALANKAGKNDAAFEKLLQLLEDPDETLRKMAARFSGSIAVNERGNHRRLHDLLKAIKGA